MPLTIKILGTVLIALGCLGVAALLIVLMAAFPYLIANQYGDAGTIVGVFLALMLVSAGIVYLGYRLRKKSTQMSGGRL